MLTIVLLAIRYSLYHKMTRIGQWLRQWVYPKVQTMNVPGIPVCRVCSEMLQGWYRLLSLYQSFYIETFIISDDLVTGRFNRSTAVAVSNVVRFFTRETFYFININKAGLVWLLNKQFFVSYEVVYIGKRLNISFYLQWNSFLWSVSSDKADSMGVRLEFMNEGQHHRNADWSELSRIHYPCRILTPTKFHILSKIKRQVESFSYILHQWIRKNNLIHELFFFDTIHY